MNHFLLLFSFLSFFSTNLLYSLWIEKQQKSNNNDVYHCWGEIKGEDFQEFLKEFVRDTVIKVNDKHLQYALRFALEYPEHSDSPIFFRLLKQLYYTIKFEKNTQNHFSIELLNNNAYSLSTLYYIHTGKRLSFNKDKQKQELEKYDATLCKRFPSLKEEKEKQSHKLLQRQYSKDPSFDAFVFYDVFLKDDDKSHLVRGLEKIINEMYMYVDAIRKGKKR